MGNHARPGTVVVREIDHDPFPVDAEEYVVRELVWNGIDGRSFELVRRRDDEVLTRDASVDAYPTQEQIAAVLEDHGVAVDLEVCKVCRNAILRSTAYRHDHGWVGSCCWDDRLHSTA
ncbi:MAG: hypothetical protein HOV68_33660 [Streptomycetaceae bacterium]|nr:hypothetical protein [Streptomycetaceae bacterium]